MIALVLYEILQVDYKEVTLDMQYAWRNACLDAQQVGFVMKPLSNFIINLASTIFSKLCQLVVDLSFDGELDRARCDLTKTLAHLEGLKK